MKKKILSYCLFGAPTGLALWVMFTILASYLRGDGEYHMSAYYLIRVYGTELNAVTAQCICAMVIGMIWSAASLIYQDTEWSLLKQTGVHFVVCTVPALAAAYLMCWMPRSLDGLAQYLLLFGGLYGLNWLCQYLGMKKRVAQMNARLQGERE